MRTCFGRLANWNSLRSWSRRRACAELRWRPAPGVRGSRASSGSATRRGPPVRPTMGSPSSSKPSALSCSMTHTDVGRAGGRPRTRTSFGRAEPTLTSSTCCECGGNACAERLAVGVSDYLRVRRWDGRFSLVPGHQDLELENVVERHKSWLVVQTHEPFRALQPDERRRPGRPWG
jgi:hypothetical protein